ncbi:glycoside hydrolase family 26 protein [Agrococcus jejuensis]|uniref:Glycosyl hydrolase family 26 n=1 Tax=Agrococcus jejuensis TaxID=399736 RepID=A0A1G8DNJ5_9MICO|nr:glycosyl hydrolase [Agrococcus jejuensis]SDH59236.1 Glycosyl hydrolase family 26 [Agrococcus jejuensis]
MTRRRRLRTTLAVGVAVLLLLAGCSSPVGDATGDDDPFADVPLVPASGVYLGVYYGDREPDETDDAIGRVPQLHLTYVGWEDAWSTDPVLALDRERGQRSLVNWEPFGVDFADIVAGRYDDMLVQRGQEAALLPDPVFVDFAAEMNEEEGWGGHDPELYVAAYRHVHDVVDAHAGGNVVWVWAPNNVDSAGAPPAMAYYPGDDVVDWTGIDGYNWGTSDADFVWQSFEDVFRDMYDELSALGKPIIVGETASAEEGGSKPDWIAAIVPTLEQDFPDIRALVWFDVDKERDWRIGSSDEAAAAFQAMAADPLFQTSDR